MRGRSLNEAAMALRLSREQTLRLILRGELVGQKDGTRWVVDAASVDRMRDRLEPRDERPLEIVS